MFTGTFRTLCNPGIFRTLVYSVPWYIQSPGIFRTLLYSEPWYIQSPGIFRTLVHSENWHIQNPLIFRTLLYSDPWHIQNPGIFRALVYSEPWQTLLNIYDGAISRKCYFYNINLSSSPLFEQKYDFFNNLYSRSIWGATTVSFWYTYLLMYSSKLAYLDLITVLLYGSSPHKSRSYLTLIRLGFLIVVFSGGGQFACPFIF